MSGNTARWFADAVTMSVGLFVSSMAVAQHGPDRHGPGADQREDGQTPNLTGEWTLNEALSDDPAKAMQSLHGGTDGRRPSGGMGGHGPGMHGGGGHGGMDPAKRQALQARVSRALDAPARLTITQADGSVTWTDDDGRSQTVPTNNRKEQRPLDGRMVDVRAKWDDGRLVKETSLEDGLKLTETYSLAPDPRQLHVLVKLEGAGLPRAVNLRRVYDPERTR